MLLVTDDRYIHFISKGWVGKIHDYSLLKHEFPPEQGWFKNLKVMLDSGYQGFTNDYDCQEVVLPKKRSKHQPLTDEDKANNRQKSQLRIRVEHAIGGLKRYRFLSDRLRIHDCGLYNLIVGVCAGLWNLYLVN